MANRKIKEDKDGRNRGTGREKEGERKTIS